MASTDWRGGGTPPPAKTPTGTPGAPVSGSVSRAEAVSWIWAQIRNVTVPTTQPFTGPIGAGQQRPEVVTGTQTLDQIRDLQAGLIEVGLIKGTKKNPATPSGTMDTKTIDAVQHLLEQYRANHNPNQPWSFASQPHDITAALSWYRSATGSSAAAGGSGGGSGASGGVTIIQPQPTPVFKQADPTAVNAFITNVFAQATGRDPTAKEAQALTLTFRQFERKAYQSDVAALRTPGLATQSPDVQSGVMGAAESLDPTESFGQKLAGVMGVVGQAMEAKQGRLASLGGNLGGANLG